MGPQAGPEGGVVSRASHLAHAIGGRNAKRAGNDFEDELDAMHERWRAAGTAALQRGHPATVVAGHRSGRPAIRYTGKNGVDFVGVYRTFAVAIEAKSRAGAVHFALLDREDRDTERAECQWLIDHARAGALAFYLVRDPEFGRVYAITAEHFPTLIGGGKVRLREDNTPAHRRGGVAPRACLPCLERTEADLVRCRVLGTDCWPWPRLFPHLPPLP